LSLQAVSVSDDVTRCGFVVSKRVSLKAVVRNTVRRRLREIVRSLLPQLAPGHDLVLSARPAAAMATFEELDAAVRDLLTRAKILSPAMDSGEDKSRARTESSPVETAPGTGRDA
jgi:ribonuclease P protein component